MTHEYAYVGGEGMVEQMERSYNEMVARDAEAKAEGTLVGRYLQERAADGYAYYEIVAINRTGSLEIEHLDIYDGWTVPMYEGMMDCFPRHYAVQNIEARDATEGLFAK